MSTINKQVLIDPDAMMALGCFEDQRQRQSVLSLAWQKAAQENVAENVRILEIHVRRAAEELFGEEQVANIGFNWAGDFPMP